MKAIVCIIGILFLFILTFVGCTSSGTDQQAATPLMDTVITEIRDTIITFYPDTYEEVMQVVTSYDTVISPKQTENR